MNSNRPAREIEQHNDMEQVRQRLAAERQQAEFQRLKSENDQLRAAAARHETAIDGLKSENDRLTANNTSHRRDIASLTAENNQLRTTVARHETAIDGLKTRNMTLKSKVSKQRIAAIIGLIVAFGGFLYCCKDKIASIFGGKSQNPQIQQQISEDNARREREQSFRKQAENIYADLADNFSAFVNSGAVEAFDIAGNPSDTWRGMKIFPADGSSHGIIRTQALASAFSSSLLADTLEIADSGTVFQADISQSAKFIPGDIIRSSFTPSSSFKPSSSSSSPSRSTIINDITDRLKSGTGSYGYARFFLRTSTPNISLMAAYNLDPYAPTQCRKFLVLGGEYIFADSGRLREIEDSVRVRSDINAAVFTLKSGSVSKIDGLSGCLRKFADGFTK